MKLPIVVLLSSVIFSSFSSFVVVDGFIVSNNNNGHSSSILLPQRTDVFVTSMSSSSDSNNDDSKNEVLQKLSSPPKKKDNKRIAKKKKSPPKQKQKNKGSKNKSSKSSSTNKKRDSKGNKGGAKKETTTGTTTTNNKKNEKKKFYTRTVPVKDKRTLAKKKRMVAKQKKTDESIYNRVMADMIFDLIDRNNDGGISNDELVQYLEEEGILQKLKDEGEESLLSIRYLFTALDSNADGRISREEMQFAFDNYEIPALYRAFGLEDTVTKTIYSDAVSTIRKEEEEEKSDTELLLKLADLIFDRIDTDRSGEIDVMELRTHFTTQFFAPTVLDDLVEDGADVPPITRGLSPSGLVESTTATTEPTQAESILEALDLNHDGVISREEMRQGFQQYDPRALSKALGLPVLFCE